MVMPLDRKQELLDTLKEYQVPQNDFLTQVSKLPQEQALKVLNVSAQSGLSLQDAARNPRMVIDSIIHPDEFAELQKSNPATYQFLNNDPLYMAAVRSKNRVQALASIETKDKVISAFQNGFKGIGQALLGTAKSFADNFAVSDAKTTKMLNDAFSPSGFDSVKGSSDFLNAVSSGIDTALKSDWVKRKDRPEGYLYDFIETAPQVGAQIAAAFLSSGSTVPTLFMGSQIMGSEYLKLRQDGVSVERAGQAALIDAIAQTPLERLSLNRLFKAVKTPGMGQKLTEIAKTTVTEAMTEWAQQYPEAMIEIWAKNPNFSADERSQQFYKDFWSITREGAYQGLVAAPFGFLGGAVKVAFQKQVAQTSVEQSEEKIEAMRKSGIEPAILQGHSEAINKGAKVRIDGKALSGAMYQSSELAEQLGINEDEVQKAAQTGQMVEVDESKYNVTMMENPEVQQALRKDVAFGEETLSINQADMYNAPEIKKVHEEIFREQNEVDIEKKQIYEQWKTDTRGTEGINARVLNDTMTALVSHAYQFAPIENMTPAEWMRTHAPVMRKAIWTNQEGLMQPMNADVNPETQVTPVDITNALPKTIVTNKDLVAHIKNLASEGTALNTADHKAIMSILPRNVKHIVYSSNKDRSPEYLEVRKGSLLSIGDLIRNAILIESLPNKKNEKKPKAGAYHRFYVPIAVNGSLRTVRIVAEERNGVINLEPKNVDLYDVLIEKKRTAPSTGNKSGMMTPSGSLSTISIQDMLSGVKDADGNNYFQSKEKNPRGMIQYNEEGRAIISLFENADPSTVIHEMGHFFMGNLLRAGAMDTAPDWVKKDHQTLLKFGGVENWETATPEQQKAVHEKIAGATETYLMEGEAPSLELRSVFRRFKDWIVAVYQQLKQDKVELTPEVREAFDRLLASDAAIKEMEVVNEYHKRLPAEALETLSESARRDLDRSLLNAQADAEEIVRKKMMQNITAANKEAMKEERVKATEKIGEEVSKEKIYREMDIVEANFAECSKTAKGFAEKYLDWRSHEITATEAEAEMKFDIIAESLGYSSGDELAQKIVAAPTKAQEVKNRVKAYMEQRFEDIYGNRERMEEEARSAMYNDDGAYLIAMEQQVIEESLGRVLKADERRQMAALKREGMHKAAQKELARLPVKQAIRPHNYMQAERGARKRAEKALLEGDYELASYEKSVQLYNHALVMESLNIKRKFEMAQKYMKRQKKAKKETWVKEEHFNQAAAIMGKFGYGRKDYEELPGSEPLRDWVDRMSEENDSISIAPWLMMNHAPKQLKDLYFEQCEDIVNALKNIKKVAQTEDQFFREGRTKSIGKTIQTAEEKLSDHPDVLVPEAQNEDERTVKESFQQFLRSAEKITTFLGKLDNWNDFGFFYDLIYRPIYDAANKASNIMKDMKDLLKDSLDRHYTKAEQKLLSKRIYHEELQNSVDKKYLLEMASHVGNEHNFNVLASTPPYGLEKSSLWIKEDIDTTKANIMGFLQENLTAKDWRYVQDGWNIIDRLWPLAQAVHTKMTGFGMKKVEASSFTVKTKEGETIFLDGGYYPLKEDPRANNRAEKREAEGKPLYTEGFGVYAPKTSTGYTNKRQKGAKFAVDLRSRNRYRHIQAVVHDIAFREAITDARRLLNNQKFKDLLERKAGREGYAAVRDFIAAAATPQTETVNSGQEWADNLANGLRHRTVISTLMFNVGTATQNAANIFLYGNAVDGFTHVDNLHAFINRGIFRHWSSVSGFKSDRKFVFEKSAFMRDRESAPDFALNEFNDKENIWTKWGGAVLAEMDNLTAIPVWLEAYHKKIREGSSDQDAVMFADMLINNSIGSGRKIDTASLLRGNALLRMLTMFGSFMNTQYNAWEREVGIALRDRNAKAAGRLLVTATSRLVLFSVFSNILVGGLGDDEEKDLRDWALEILNYSVKLFPIFGNVGAVALNVLAGERTMGVRLSPIENVAESIENAFRAGKGYVDGKKDSADLLEAGSVAVSYFKPYPQQFNKWFWNAYDILFEDMDPELKDIYKRRPRRER